MNMNEYARLLAENGMDVEKDMALYENMLRETQGQTHVFSSSVGKRILRHENGKKLLHLGEGFNFENGLKNLIENIGKKNVKDLASEPEKGSLRTSSNIDEWVISGLTLAIKAEKGSDNFVIGATQGTDRDQAALFEVSSSKLLSAFEWFNDEMRKINAINNNRLAKVMFGDGVRLKTDKTVRHQISTDSNGKEHIAAKIYYL